MHAYSMIHIVSVLATVATARPSEALRKRQNTCIVQTVANPSIMQIMQSINQWNADVNAVNDFLNRATGLDGDMLKAAAMAAQINAQDEPCQLATLSSIPDLNPAMGGGTAASNCAVTDLQNIFQVHVLDKLATIIAGPTDTATLNSAVNDINLFRCCNVLPDASILFRDAAENAGIFGTLQTTANREMACASVDCSRQTPVCQGLDNGSFGA